MIFPMHHRYLLVARKPNIPTPTQGKISIVKLGLAILVISSARNCLLLLSLV